MVREEKNTNDDDDGCATSEMSSSLSIKKNKILRSQLNSQDKADKEKTQKKKSRKKKKKNEDDNLVSTTEQSTTKSTGDIIKHDRRNMEWKSNNLGSKLLSKMGWETGQAVGKRQRENNEEISGEGIRVVKRQDNLGIGAMSSSAVLATCSSSSTHTQDFANVLASLSSVQDNNGNDTKSKKKKKKSKKENSIVLSTNRLSNTKIRDAKLYRTKTDDELKCIFGGASNECFVDTTSSCTTTTKRKKKRQRDDNTNDESNHNKRSKKKKKIKQDV